MTSIWAHAVAHAVAQAQVATPESPAAADPSAEALQAVVRVSASALRTMSSSMVRIETIGGAQPAGSGKGGQGGGSRGPEFRQGDGPTTGVIWSADGYIVTSSFNFLRDPTVTTVTTFDERRFVARLIARDTPGRIALLKIDATNLSVASRAPLAELKQGQWVVAAGYGQGTGMPSPSLGILSAAIRMNGMAVQTDAKISPANYGGPLFDLDGRLIGICVPMGMSTDDIAGVDWYDSGIGFATRTDRIDRHFEKMRGGRSVERGLLGVTLEPDDLKPRSATQSAGPRGLRVAGDPRGPAIAAGMLKGDLIVELDGQPTPRLVDLRRALWAWGAGDTVRVRYVRDGEDRGCEITLATADELSARDETPTSRPADSQPADPIPRR
ncbi:MAG: trypsin-like peptidase domain-containing protein [Phycisphaerales bacterium]|nr:trypsin-like peptidase domain-containing protein [Phycisphaerales bacterium]